MRDVSVFKNEEVLSTEFLPEMLPFRESQIKEVAGNLEPVSKGRKGQNTFIFGDPGIGKTATVRYIFRNLEDEYPSVKPIYINCWDFNTSIALLSKITTELGMFVPRRGLGKDEINDKFLEAMRKTKKNVVVCLDEADQLIFKEPGALYNLLRVNQYVDKDITIVLISNNPHIFAKLESRVTSSLNVEEIEFKPYNITEMKEILKERSKYAFHSFESAAILLAANQAVTKGGDVRIGLQCLQKGGRNAEKKGDSKLKVSYMKDVVKAVNDVKSEIVKKKVNENEKIIVDMVNRLEEISFTKLYEKYCKKVDNPVSVRMFQDYVKHLQQTNMIRTSEKKIAGKRMIYKK